MDDRRESEKAKPSIMQRLGFARRENVSEEEIKDIVNDASELLEDEKRMIHEIIDLGGMSVREIMIPRVDMMLVEDIATAKATLERMRGTGYSRLPVFHEEIDDIVGIVHYKDLIAPLMDGSLDEAVSAFMYAPMFIPETKDVIPLLGEMQAAHQQMAIVVDEYGGCAGLITLEDIVEEIVGEIIDETDLHRDYITEIGSDIWRADGRFPVEEAVALGWPVTESDDYETLAGWLMDAFESVPKTGDEFIDRGYSFKVEKMRRSRISTVKVTQLETQEQTEFEQDA